MSTWGDIEDKVSRLVGAVPTLTKVPAAFAKGRAFLSQKQADVATLEAELAQLTNLPLSGSTAS